MRLLKLSLLFSFILISTAAYSQMFANQGDIFVSGNNAVLQGTITLDGGVIPTGTEIAAFEETGNIVGVGSITEFEGLSFYSFAIYQTDLDEPSRNQLTNNECFTLAIFLPTETDSFDVVVDLSDPRLCSAPPMKGDGKNLDLNLTSSNGSRSLLPSEFGPYFNTMGSPLNSNWDVGTAPPLNILPVEYSSITLTNNDCKQVSFDWTTSSEINNEGFYVERKVEGGRKWESLDFVAGNGTSNREIEYSFKDVEIVKDKSLKVVYYRLKQVDYDGRIEYSDTKAIRLNCGNARFVHVFPNPTKDEINLEVNYEGLFQENVTIEIYSMDGQLMQRNTMQLTDKEAVLIQTSDFAPGVYNVHAFTDRQIIAHTRFTKI